MKNNNNFNNLNIYISLIILIILLILLQCKNINANNITLDTNKLTAKLEIQNLTYTLYSEINNIDSIFKTNNVLDSLGLLRNNSRGLNFEDIDTEIEFFTDSIGQKQLKIIVSGVSSDSFINGVKKIEIKINDDKQSKNNLETPKEEIKNEFKEDTKFDFEKMSDEEIKYYIKAHHKENLTEGQIEISRENGNIIIIIKKEKSKEN